MIYESEITDKLKEYGFKNGIKIFSILEELRKKIVDHGCKKRNVTLDGFTFFCNKCNRIILRVCLACGSTKFVRSRFFVKCSNCGVVIENKLLSKNITKK